MGLQGVQQLPPIFFIDKVGGRGDWGLEPFLRSMDALWLTILRRGGVLGHLRTKPAAAQGKKQWPIAAAAVCHGRVSIIF